MQKDRMPLNCIGVSMAFAIAALPFTLFELAQSLEWLHVRKAGFLMRFLGGVGLMRRCRDQFGKRSAKRGTRRGSCAEGIVAGKRNE